MKIILNNTSMVPIYEQLISQIRTLILEGSLVKDDALPSVRALSNELKISALTVKKAYDLLEKEGYVVTVHGKGTYVSGADRQLAKEYRQKSIEDSFQRAIDLAKSNGLSNDEIKEIISILLETEGE